METTLYLILNFLELGLILLSNATRLFFGVPFASMVRGVTLPDCCKNIKHRLYMTRKESCKFFVVVFFCFMYVSFTQFVPSAYACAQIMFENLN